MDEFNKLLQQLEKERQSELDALPPPSVKEVVAQAAFLRGWSKGKPIRKMPGVTTFHTCGKWTTMIEPLMVKALLDGKHAYGNTHEFTVPRGNA